MIYLFKYLNNKVNFVLNECCIKVSIKSVANL